MVGLLALEARGCRFESYLSDKNKEALSNWLARQTVNLISIALLYKSLQFRIRFLGYLTK